MRRALALALLLLPAPAQDNSANVKGLVENLGSPDEQTRATAARDLGRLGPRAKSAAPALVKALGDDSAWVAERAFEALGKIGPDAVPALVKALPGADPYVRAGAMRLLDDSFGRDLKPHLRTIAPLLKDENAETRVHAAGALGQQGGEAVDLLIAMFAAREPQARDAAILGITKVGGDAVPALLRSLASGSEQVRATAARALGALKAAGARPALVAALGDRSPEVAAAAARAVAEAGVPAAEVLPRLLEGLRDPNAAFRDACIAGLVSYEVAALPALVAALGAEETRAAASLAFLRMDKGGAAALGEALSNGSVEIRRGALEALAGFNPALVHDDVVAAAILALRDDDKGIRVAAARTLAALGPRGKDDWLRAMATHDDPAIRAAAFFALGELGLDTERTDDADPLARVEALLASWKTGGAAGAEDLRKIACDASADARVRAAATDAIGAMGFSAMGTDLAPLLEGSPVEVRRAAARALARTTLPSAETIRDARALVKPDGSVTAGLVWLAKAQADDGQWDAGGHTIGTTGLALLAFLGAGITPNDGTHGTTVRRGLMYLLRSQGPRGFLGKDKFKEYLVGNSAAIMALTEAYILTGEYRYRRSAQWALDHIAWARTPGLAWRYEPRGTENDTHVTTWLLTATRLGDAAGLHVDRDAYAGAGTWIERMTNRGGRTGYNSQGGLSARQEGDVEKLPADLVEAMTAAGLWCRQLIGGEPLKDPVYKKGINLVLAKEPCWGAGRTDMVYWYFGALALFQDGEAPYRRWEKPLSVALAAGRDPKTGAWRAEDAWASCLDEAGQTYATSMGVLTLLAPVRYPRGWLSKPKISAATRAALAALRKACSDEDAEVREIAAAACARLGG